MNCAELISIAANSASASNAFVVEYDPSVLNAGFAPSFVRAAKLSSATSVFVSGVGASTGGVWLYGAFSGTTTGLATLASNGGPDAFLLELQGSGTGFGTLLARHYGGAGDETPQGFAVDAAGG